MIVIALITVLAAGAGVAAEHRAGDRADHAAQRVLGFMLWVLTPPITFVNVVRLHLDERVTVGIAFGGVAVTVALLAAYVLGRRVFALRPDQTGALMLVAAFGNTGFLGLPVVTALYGGGELANAIAYDLVLTALGIFTVGFSIGAAFGTAAGSTRERMRAFVTRNPPLWAAVLGLLAPAALAPDWAVDVSHVLVYALPVLGFFAVGVILAAEAEEDALAFPPPLTGPVAAAVGIKLLLVPAVVLALSAAVLDVPRSFPAEAAMASAINCLLIAQLFGLDRALVAAAVTWSTAIVIVAGLAVSLL